jgi:hypothetical protein
VGSHEIERTGEDIEREIVFLAINEKKIRYSQTAL